MAKKIQMWGKYGPRLALGAPMKPDEIIDNIIAATNQSKGSVLAVLAELDVQITAGLKAGRIVRLPNGLRFEPIGKRDGSINIVIKTNREMKKAVNTLFRGKWINAEHIGKTEAEMIEYWNQKHPEDQIS